MSEHESILSEADRVVNRERRTEAAEPLDDFGAVAAALNAYGFRRYNRPGPGSSLREVRAEDWPTIMICMKLARNWYRQKRAHRVDIAGYAACEDRIAIERERRARDATGQVAP